MNLNYQKYKRVFAFGCSFTHYRWPTWADLISVECVNAKYYNFGQAGFGNLGIAARIIEANKRFLFNEDDLILVMWSTFCREDRWLAGSWYTMGNIYNSQYPKEFVKNFTDPLGYLIRDHAIINNINYFLNNISSDNLILKSTPFTFIESEFPEDCSIHNGVISELISLYKEDYDKMPMSFKTFCDSHLNSYSTNYQNHKIQLLQLDNTIRIDHHPYTNYYLVYLKHIGIGLSDKATLLSNESDSIMKSTIVDEKLLHEKFNYLKIKGRMLF